MLFYTRDPGLQRNELKRSEFSCARGIIFFLCILGLCKEEEKHWERG